MHGPAHVIAILHRKTLFPSFQRRAACAAGGVVGTGFIARRYANTKTQEQLMKTILVTGAAGDIGTHLRRELAGKYNLRLSDIRPIKKRAAGETSMSADIARLSDMLRVTKGVDAIVHMGGFSVEGPWDE